MLYIDNRSLLPKQTAKPTIQKIILSYRYQISTQRLQKTFSPFKNYYTLKCNPDKNQPKDKSSPQKSDRGLNNSKYKVSP